MSLIICSERDLRCQNIRAAWGFADRMTPEQFEELCRVSADHLRMDHGEETCAVDLLLTEAV